MIYMTSPTGTVHLAMDDAAQRTLCGRRLTRWWTYGDETVSGLVVDCRSCRRSIPQSRP